MESLLTGYNHDKKKKKALHLLPLRSSGKWHCTFMDPTAQRNITFASLKKRLSFLSSVLRETEEKEKKKARWELTEKGKRKKRGLLSPPSVPACLFYIFVFIERRSRNFCGGGTEGGLAWLRPKLPVLLCVPTFGSAVMSSIFQFVTETVYENQRN